MPSILIYRVQPNTKRALQNPNNTLADQLENTWTHTDIYTQTIMWKQELSQTHACWGLQYFPSRSNTFWRLLWYKGLCAMNSTAKKYKEFVCCVRPGGTTDHLIAHHTIRLATHNYWVLSSTLFRPGILKFICSF